jgi:hypothetical protein
MDPVCASCPHLKSEHAAGAYDCLACECDGFDAGDE